MALPLSLFRQSAAWCVVALGVAIPVSTALDNVLLLVILPLVLVSAGREVLHIVWHNPVARAAMLLFVALLLGTTYGEVSVGEALGLLGKYIDLAFIPLMMAACFDEEIRRRAMIAFLGVMLVTALLSWLVGLGIFPVSNWMLTACAADNPSIFRSSITQNVLMAYAAYLLVLLSREQAAPAAKWILGSLGVFAGADVLFMVQGRTGYLVLPGLLLYLAWVMISRSLEKRGLELGWRGAAGILLAACIVTLFAYEVTPRLHARMEKAQTEFLAWQPNENTNTSTGERLEFYYNSVAIIGKHPLLGVGSGGFPAAYEQQVLEGKQVLPRNPSSHYVQLADGRNVLLTNNPHNEYLLLAVQLGLGGGVLLLYLFYTQWRSAGQIQDYFRRDAARGLVITIAITAMFNSPLHDHVEGLFFAFASALLFSGLTPEKRHA